MPDVQELIRLLEAIASTGEANLNLSELIILLKKISTTTVKQHIELDYNGREWHWKMPLSNITASEYLARERKHDVLTHG
jgi:hypothetical protein